MVGILYALSGIFLNTSCVIDDSDEVRNILR